MRIQHIAYQLDGKRWIEGKIERDKEIRADKRYEAMKQIISDQVDAEIENEDLQEWKEQYGI